MDEIKIVTDNKPRELKCFMDLSERERADFDYIKDDDFYDQRFVRYKGHWYDVNDTQLIWVWPKPCMGDYAVNPDHPFAKWNCITSETFFSGVLFRWGKEYAHVVVGSYCT